jgi:Flp pilus assembly protein protease CpaA
MTANQALLTPVFLAASVLGGLTIVGLLGLGYESRSALEMCKARGMDATSCHLIVYGR